MNKIKIEYTDAQNQAQEVLYDGRSKSDDYSKLVKMLVETQPVNKNVTQVGISQPPDSAT